MRSNDAGHRENAPQHASAGGVMTDTDLSCRFLIGDVFERIGELDDSSVDLVVTSPPFMALRSYLPDDHPDKSKEIGLEPSPAEFIDTLLRLTAEFDRVLAPHGSIVVELGDTFSGSGGAGGDYGAGGMRAGQPMWKGSGRRKADKNGDSWPLAKSACMIPELFRVALAYGRNPLSGEPSPSGKWRVRNTIRWCKPNPTPGALGDKFRPATSDMVVACKSKSRWFDLDAVRTSTAADLTCKTGPDDRPVHTAGSPPLDWWEITDSGYKGSHYAAFPPELIVKPIESMCPRQVCTDCGEPRRRIAAEYGWSDCRCGAPFRRGVVLDPFGGSGTTGFVAASLWRDSVLIDLDDRNVELAVRRIDSMFVKVEQL